MGQLGIVEGAGVESDDAFGEVAVISGRGRRWVGVEFHAGEGGGSSW